SVLPYHFAPACARFDALAGRRRRLARVHSVHPRLSGLLPAWPRGLPPSCSGRGDACTDRRAGRNPARVVLRLPFRADPAAPPISAPPALPPPRRARHTP